MSWFFKYFNGVIYLGISGKSQFLFLVVFLCRYIDLFTTFISFYNTFMKIQFIIYLVFTNYLIFKKFVVTYDKINDIFPIYMIIIPCVIMTFILPFSYRIIDVFYFISSNYYTVTMDIFNLS